MSEIEMVLLHCSYVGSKKLMTLEAISIEMYEIAGR